MAVKSIDREAARIRGAKYRERRRSGAVVVRLTIGLRELEALEALGLLAEGERAPRAVAAASERFIASACAVADLAGALYPDT